MFERAVLTDLKGLLFNLSENFFTWLVKNILDDNNLYCKLFYVSVQNSLEQNANGKKIWKTKKI